MAVPSAFVLSEEYALELIDSGMVFCGGMAEVFSKIPESEKQEAVSRMKIVILDSLPGNPGDISWQALEALGPVRTYKQTLYEQITERAGTADIIITNKCRLTAEVIRALPKLKLICVTATGFDNIDIVAARAQGIAVCNVPAYSTASTAQTSIALLLELTQQCGLHNSAVRAGEWTASPTFSFWKTPLVELAGKSILLAGSGNIGSAVGRIAEALGMTVRAAVLPGRPVLSGGPFERIALEQALPETDVLSLHCPLTDQTQGLVNDDLLCRMKPSALIVNAARGPVVVEQDVADALVQNRLGGYAADVLSREPPAADNPLLTAPRCIITPHLAWATREARQRLWDVIADNIKAFIAGTPQNVVNKNG